MDLFAISNLCDNETFHLELESKILDIKPYISNNVKIKEIFKFLKKQTNSVFYDIILDTPQGKLKVLYHPLKNSIQRGELGRDSCLNIKCIRKFCNGEFFFFILESFSTIDKILNMNSSIWFEINNYHRYSFPLLGNAGTYILDIYSLRDIQFNETNLIKDMKEHQVKTSEIMSLETLDQSWTSIKFKKPIIGRVVGTSKLKLTNVTNNGVQKLIFNILIADHSSFTKVTIFDEAALHFLNKVQENDIIYLAGSYKCSMYLPRNPAYVLQPKHSLDCPQTRIELKINYHDLKNVFIIKDDCSLAYKPIWNLFKLEELKTSCQNEHQIIDLFSIPIWLARQEREKFHGNKQFENTFWIRQWIAVTQDPKQDLVYIKLYLDIVQRNSLEEVVPGDPLLLTNLKVCYDNGYFSHLESTNETSIFHEFSDQKFNPCRKTIESITKINLFQNKDWIELYKKSKVGGFLLPIAKAKNLSKNIYNVLYTKYFQIVNLMKMLEYRTTLRFVIQGQIVRISTVYFSRNQD